MSDQFKAFLMNDIEQNGAISLGMFMQHALSHPTHGYYMTRDPFGAEGDFITAPDVSQLFGEMIGAWVVDLWSQMGGGDVDLIECGPGRGTLMADILRVGQKVPEFQDKTHIHLIECSPTLKQKQQEILRGYNVSWHDGLSTISVDRSCIILGNEFLDALPIDQLKRDSSGWQQKYVGVEDGALRFVWKKAEETCIDFLPKKTESNEIYEVSPARAAFVRSCAARLKAVGGAALFIDYGHTKSHHGDTFQAVQNHGFANVLETAGRADLTAHVDFDALLRNLEDVSARPIISQGRFLQNLGIEYRFDALRKVARLQQVDDLEASYKRLIDIDQMGDMFKVMCFYKGDVVPAGFD